MRQYFLNIWESVFGYSSPLCMWPIKIQALDQQGPKSTRNSTACPLSSSFIVILVSEELLYFPESSTVL